MTRPETDSLCFADDFMARFGRDWPIVISPLLKIVILAPTIPAAEAVVFTSANAVAPFAALSPAGGRRAYCVGARTARAAAEAGFLPVTGPGDAAGLVPLIGAAARGPLIYARGRHVVSNLAETLNLAGIETFEAIVYDQVQQHLTGAARRALAAPAGGVVPLFSARTARLFVAEVKGSDATMRIAAISAAVAEPCHDLEVAQLEVALTPDSAGVMAALARLIGSAVVA